jgi:L-lactate dehydrogenase (cytochrome)
MKAASTLDFRALAKRRLPHFLFEYIDGGSFAETTLRRNVEDLEAVALRQRVLKDVSHIDLTTQLFGRSLSMPVALGPIGLGGMTARRGEVQAAAAATAAGVPFCLSTVSACSMEEVAAKGVDPFWFQLYVMRDRGFMRELMARAREARCPVLVFTVDMPVPGSRYRDVRSGLAGRPGLPGAAIRAWQALQRPAWAWDVGLMGRPHGLGNAASILGESSGLDDYFAFMRGNFDASISWKDLEAIRAEWDGPLVIKGILDVEDAREAVKLGADGLIVSNHGGRQLDGALSTARALPAIADAVGADLTVLADGGVRSGLDVVRMLALGAHAVLLGRVWPYALAAAGQAGVAQMLGLIEAEMRVAMALTGVTSIAQIDRRLLARFSAG